MTVMSPLFLLSCDVFKGSTDPLFFHAKHGSPTFLPFSARFSSRISLGPLLSRRLVGSISKPSSLATPCLLTTVFLSPDAPDFSSRLPSYVPLRTIFLLEFSIFFSRSCLFLPFRGPRPPFLCFSSLPSPLPLPTLPWFSPVVIS